jgi:hypothetical protein
VDPLADAEERRQQPELALDHPGSVEIGHAAS